MSAEWIFLDPSTAWPDRSHFRPGRIKTIVCHDTDPAAPITKFLYNIELLRHSILTRDLQSEYLLVQATVSEIIGPKVII